MHLPYAREVVRVVAPEVSVDAPLGVYAKNSATISMVMTSESESLGAGPRSLMGPWELTQSSVRHKTPITKVLRSTI
jgi:hypothetical protein